jgi:integrase
MGSVFERGGRFYLKFKDAGGRRLRQVCAAKTKRQAQLLLAELEIKIERQKRGLELLPAESGLTLGGLCEWWLENKCTPNSLERERCRLEKHILKVSLGTYPLKSVTTEAIQAHLLAMAKDGAAPATVNKLRGTLMSVFERANKANLWTGPNPVKAVERKRVIKDAHVTLRAEEVPLVLGCLSDEWRNFFAGAVWLALRKGELCGLLKTDIDWESMTLRVARSYAYDTTKGGHADVLPVPAPLAPFLRDAVAKSPSRWVFPRADGKMRTEDSSPHKILKTALAHAGLVSGYEHVCRRCKGEGKDGHTEMHADMRLRRCAQCNMQLWAKAIPRDMVFHDLRHTTATLLMRAKVPMVHIQRIMRHASIHTTTSTYGHLDVEDLRVEMEKVAPLSEQQQQHLVAVNAAPEKRGPMGVHMESAGETLSDKLSRIIKKSEELEIGRRGVRTHDHRLVKATPDVAPITSGVPNRQLSSHSSQSSDSQRSSNVGRKPPQSGPPGVQLRAVSLGERMLGVKEVAALLSVSAATVYRLVEFGHLRHSRVLSSIRISEADLAAFLKGGGK